MIYVITCDIQFKKKKKVYLELTSDVSNDNAQLTYAMLMTQCLSTAPRLSFLQSSLFTVNWHINDNESLLSEGTLR